MLTEERRAVLLTRLQRDGKIVAAEVGPALGVSIDTIRRDLQELANAGLARRVHGGALPPTSGALPYAARQAHAPLAKAAIARATAKLLHDGQVVLLDGGTTTLEVARHLAPDLEATIVTNSPEIASALTDHATVEVALLGGILDKSSRVVVGAATIDALRSIRADVLVLGICSIHPEVGITVDELEESYVKRAMIANAAEVVAVASIDKLGSAAQYVVAPVSELTHLVTDESLPAADLERYRALGVEVVVA